MTCSITQTAGKPHRRATPAKVARLSTLKSKLGDATTTDWDLLKTPQAQQGVVGHRFNLVPLQVDVGQVLHASDGSRDPPEVVLKAQQLLQRRLLDEDAVGDAEQVAVRQVQPQQLLQPGERPRVQVADVLIVRHFQLHQVGEALQDRVQLFEKTRLPLSCSNSRFSFFFLSNGEIM